MLLPSVSVNVCLLMITASLAVGGANQDETEETNTGARVRPDGQQIVQCLTNKTNFALRKIENALEDLQDYLESTPEYETSEVRYLVKMIKKARMVKSVVQAALFGGLAGFLPLVSLVIDGCVAAYEVVYDILNGTVSIFVVAGKVKDFLTIVVDLLMGKFFRTLISRSDKQLQKQLEKTLDKITMYLKYAVSSARGCIGLNE
ncbi:hypothetical protein BIW11_00660 [Tropilaelaps mercedesae]|uniref:Uncharacterized protein n=1 Tax=Tropilaelaps mercedesae TaxID=418985 RepID=A0A1V9XRD8_9ACAR|nr:hypothetical protein BIW11_00660 [Tropilaelaps mercedesae]